MPGRSWVGAVLALVVLAAPQARGASAAATEEAAGLVEGGPAPNLILVYTGDVIGYVDPCG